MEQWIQSACDEIAPPNPSTNQGGLKNRRRGSDEPRQNTGPKLRIQTVWSLDTILGHVKILIKKRSKKAKSTHVTSANKGVVPGNSPPTTEHNLGSSQAVIGLITDNAQAASDGRKGGAGGRGAKKNKVAPNDAAPDPDLSTILLVVALLFMRLRRKYTVTRGRRGRCAGGRGGGGTEVRCAFFMNYVVFKNYFYEFWNPLYGE